MSPLEAAVLVAGLAALWWATRRKSEVQRRLEAQPRRPISTFAPGVSGSFVGHVAIDGDRVLTAPLSGVACVYFVLERRDGDEGFWCVAGGAATPFRITDGSGEATIRLPADGRDWSADTPLMFRFALPVGTKDDIHRERILQAGDRVWVHSRTIAAVTPAGDAFRGGPGRIEIDVSADNPLYLAEVKG